MARSYRHLPIRNLKHAVPWIVPLLVGGLLVYCVWSLRDINRSIDVYEQRIRSRDDHSSNCTTERNSPKSGHDYTRIICDEECSRRRHLTRSVNCVGLMEGDSDSLTNAAQFMLYHPHIKRTDASRAKLTSNCLNYRARTFYPSDARSQEEKNYPIAYSIVAHKDTFQLEKLLQAIYWPQNWYCIHVDRKAPADMVQAVVNLANCLPHVVLPSRREAVVYGAMSRLQADLNCMEELVKSNRSWKYLINLTGQEYPLRTNLELVNILKIYNGTNDIEGISKQGTLAFRNRFAHPWVPSRSGTKLIEVKTEEKPPPPKGITPIKGSAFGVFSRAFVEFVLSDELVKEFLSWLADTWSPDELFWATLNTQLYNPMFRTPGAYRATPEHKQWLAKYASWPPYDECHGKVVRSICIFSHKDLGNLISRKHLFANKFHMDYDYLVLDCLEQWLHNKTYHKRFPFDYHVYRNLPFVLQDHR